jgi:hypothetical protein
MNAAGRNQLNGTPGLWKEILDMVRSEPALSWFLAQAVWTAQPALESFWPQEKIEALAESLESALGPAAENPRGGADGGAEG